MKNREAHIIFKVVLDKNAEGVAYGGCPAFLNEEVDIFLNQALLEILSNKITGNNTLGIPMEGTVSNISEIENLITTEENLIANLNQYNEFIVSDIKDKGKRLTILSALLKYGQFLANCGITSHEIARPFKQTYNNVPWVETPIATLLDDQMFVYVDPILMLDPAYAPRANGSKSYYKLNLTYIRSPRKFNSTLPEEELEFPEDVMYEIINRAVVIALENIESQRQSSKMLLNQVSE